MTTAARRTRSSPKTGSSPKHNFSRPILGLVSLLVLLRFLIQYNVADSFSDVMNGISGDPGTINAILMLASPNKDVLDYFSPQKAALFGLPVLLGFSESPEPSGAAETIPVLDPSTQTSIVFEQDAQGEQDEQGGQDEQDLEIEEHEILPDETPIGETDPFTADDPNAKRLLEVTIQPSNESYEHVGNVAVNNETGKYNVNVEALLGEKSYLKKQTADKPQVLIIHTHGTESYLPFDRNFYLPEEIERHIDSSKNVLRLGEELKEKLTDLGLNVIHDTELYDYPSYNGSYGRSLAAIQKYMKEYPSIQVVIDLHRDAIQSRDGTMYKTITETDKGKSAQLMFVLGSDASGLIHDGWKKNLSLAAKLQKAVLEEYPNLMRPIHLRKERFNQHATYGSFILEVGTAGNTMEEALTAIDLFAETAGKMLAEQILEN